MNIGKACAVFTNISSEKFTVEEKGLAIHKVLSMETTNGITKQEFKNVLKWLWNEHFEIKIESET